VQAWQKVEFGDAPLNAVFSGGGTRDCIHSLHFLVAQRSLMQSPSFARMHTGSTNLQQTPPLIGGLKIIFVT